MKNHIARFTLLALCFAQAHAELLPSKGEEFDELRTSYKKAVELATKPVEETYLKSLQTLLESRTKGKKLDEAIEIKAEMERLISPGTPTAGDEKSLELKNLRISYKAAL